MCDGSVKVLNNNTPVAINANLTGAALVAPSNLGTLHKLAVRNDGLPINASEY